MESNQDVPLIREDLESITAVENSKILQIFELCLQPKTKEDLDNILLNFQERIKTMEEKEREFFGMFDYACLYVLDYVFTHDTASFCSVSRALYLYHKLNRSILEDGHRSLTCNYGMDCLLNSVREFTNLYADPDSEDLLIEVWLTAILTGNIGLTFYLIKFRLIEIPSEVNEKCRKLFKVLVNMFNSSFKTDTENFEDDDDMETPVSLDDLLNRVKEKETNIKRSVLTFCILTVVAEYIMQEKLEEELKGLKDNLRDLEEDSEEDIEEDFEKDLGEDFEEDLDENIEDDSEEDFEGLKFVTEEQKNMCLRNLMCINAFINATMELRITFRDIENFTEEFLNPFITAAIGKSLVETCGKLLDDSHRYYNTRSLKDLARLKVRSIFQNSMSVPEQVNKLDIAVALKEFLNFSGQGIWKWLVNNHINHSLEQELRRHAEDILEEVENVDATLQELEDRN